AVSRLTVTLDSTTQLPARTSIRSVFLLLEFSIFGCHTTVFCSFAVTSALLPRGFSSIAVSPPASVYRSSVDTLPGLLIASLRQVKDNTDIQTGGDREKGAYLHAQSRRERMARARRSWDSGRPTPQALLARCRGSIRAEQRKAKKESEGPGRRFGAVPRSQGNVRSRRGALLPLRGIPLLWIRRGGRHPLRLSWMEVRSLRQMPGTAL